ncbi:Protein SSD1 AltName: Full=Protein SRK1 [Cyberlindnera jadinii]|uniref:SSD1 protein n=1 Tax=Cyberlindnera jadinii (strain ATCC 18201 / CBS 1600 / BCRC 20928 / JCM 3617 / NBRC 0987 / NRRL Y-1542) TaxID=983966 RepID=A0A0H5C7B8_CYBJN|nr:Protein SSD1 AltName: Full=Protein SRK1 [Cyberlindnera jadinii]
MSRYNPQQPSFTTTTGGKNPKQIHIAHRRSPSELTNLMMEQIALQRQLEIVQQQQHQLLAQQTASPSGSGLGASSSSHGAVGGGSGGNLPVQIHRRTGSGSGGGNGMGSVSNNTHRRAQSSSMTGAMGSFAMPSSTVNSGNSGSKGNAAQGHLRRHSLGLNEAKRAAAQVQAQRAGKELPGTSSNDEDRSSMPPPSGFKFPPTLVEPPSMHSQQQGHQRSRSMASPQKQNPYQFPPRENTLSPSHHQQHERRQSGHYRSNSRSFDQQYNNSNNNSNNNRTRQGRNHSQQFDNGKFLAPPGSTGGFVPGHRSRGSHGGGSISSISGFQSQSGRKSLFAPYLPQSSIPDLVADGRLVVGTLRVNKKNRSDAYVSTDGLLDADIFICGSKDRNRALEGDLVAVELLSVDEVWSSKREKEEKKRRKDNNNSSNGPSAGDIVDDVHNDASTHTSGATQASSSGAESKSESGLQRRGSLKQRPTLKKNDDVEVEGQSLLLVEEEEISDEYKPLYAGHVVAVIDRIPGQLFAGTLGLLRPSQQVKEQTQPVQRPKIVWFKPTDKKVPLIAIPTEQAPRDFVENVDKYLNKVFVASIKRWPITSLHPFGTLISELGIINDPKIEVDAILRDNNFLCEEYLDNDGVEREDFDLDDVDLDEEFAKRRDFTDEYVLAITETGEFSDHAIHVKRIDNEKIELGVHIADVTQYLREGSPLDKSARKRSSSVFLAQKTVHLLPKFLNDLVSFKKGEKNLSVSVAFEIDTATFEIDNVWIGESFVEPKNLLSFDDIDSIFANTDELGNISSASKDYVKTIALISREFKRQRLESSKLDSNVVLSLLDQVDDGQTGEFSDHAIHVKRIDNEKIELGVHIADVTQYLREGSPLDKSARKRSSSVFLAQKTVHLLPKFLNDLVSFKKGEKNLSVSVAFEIDTATFEIDNVWIGESFVEPKNLLSFDDIDSIFANTDELGSISSASKDYVKTIALISREFKHQRLESSKLDSNVVLSLLDQVDDEKVRLDLNLFESSLCGSVLNEIFLKVNSTVAQRVYAILGDTAFLRRHPMPTLQKLETFKRKVTQMGFEIDTSSPASLVTSIINIEDKVSRECVEILLHKALSRSKYFIAGKVEPENYLSFYFNLPLYTHFTSPLRRYADIIVHRQLKKTLKGNGETIVVTDEDLESLKMTAEYCNFKKDCAKAAQDQSVHLLLCQTLNKIAHSTGQVIVMATVLQVYESAFDVFIPEFGIEKRVHGDQLPLKKAEFDNANSVLELYWEKGIDTATYIPDDEREPLSYRNSIKNKFKVGTNEIASKLQNSSSADDSVCEEFAKLKLTPPSIPEMKHKTLDDLFQNVPLRVEGDDLVQEIHELSQVPILLRAEIGMALPCLTVHAVNPFTNY